MHIKRNAWKAHYVKDLWCLYEERVNIINSRSYTWRVMCDFVGVYFTLAS